MGTELLCMISVNLKLTMVTETHADGYNHTLRQGIISVIGSVEGIAKFDT